MRWEEFLASERVAAKRAAGKLHMLGDTHCYYLIVADADRYEDNGWPAADYDGRAMIVQGAIINHRTADGNTCGGGVNFARQLNPSERERNRPVWEVHSRDPLTISPSVLCHCGEHGFIRDGRWVAA